MTSDQETRIGVRRILGAFCPRRLKEAVKACPQRQQQIENVATMVARQLGPNSIGNSNDESWIEHEVIAKWAGKDLLHRAKTYHFYLKLSHVLLWIGMLSAIFTCALLLGMYMQVNFPHTPHVWIFYSHIVGVNGGLAIVFALWMWLSGTSPLVDSSAPASCSTGSFESSPGNDSSFCRDSSRFQRSSTFSRSSSVLPLGE